MNNRTYIHKFILSSYVIWRVLLFAVALYAIKVIPFKASFPYWETLLEPNGHPLLWGWGNFDGVHYLTIAAKGYSAQFTQAFFPLYPLSIRLLSNLVGNLLFSGLIISHLAFLVTLYLFYRIVELDHNKFEAKRTLIYLLLFPTAYYFVSVYSESLFMMLVLAAFFAARKEKWWFAAILAALASATRLFGIFLLPSLLVEWYLATSKAKKLSAFRKYKPLLPILLSASGLVAYMYYLKQTFNDPLLFLHVQPAFGAQRSADKLILLYQVFYRYAKMLLTVEPRSLLYYTVSQEALTGFVFAVLSVLAFKYTRKSYALFGIFSYITPTLTGTFSSLPRYALVLFPCFLLLGLVKNRNFQRIWWLASAILLTINTALFIRGYWVA